MGETTVEVEGELAHEQRTHATPVAGTVAAVAIAGLLAFGIGVLVLGSERGRASMSTTPAKTTRGTVTAVPSSLSFTTLDTASSAATTTEPSTTTPTVEQEVLATTEQALTQWGQFVVSGDPSVLASFDPEGPQYRALVADPPQVTGDPYRVVVLAHQLVAEGPNEAQLRALVEWSRSGEAAQQHTWGVTLKNGGSAWRLWTVERLSV